VASRDPAVVDSLRREGKVVVVAHVEDLALADAIARQAGVDAVLADPDLAAGCVTAEGGGEVPVYTLRPSVTWEAARPDPPPARARDDGLSGPAAPRPGLTVRDPGGDEAAGRLTLRDWWRLSANSTRERPVERRPATALMQERLPEVLMRQVIAVVSPKGGVGKTFVSVNLAAGLARHTGFRVVLLDMDLHSGDAAVHLDLLGGPSMADLVPYAGELDGNRLSQALVTHPASRLRVLLAPARPEAAELVADEHLEALLRVVRQGYDFAVIDTSPDPSHPLVARCLEEATSVVLVSSLDAAALRQCRLFLDSMKPDGGPAPAKGLALVLNQAHTGGPLAPERAAAFLDHGPGHLRTFLVPEDRAAVERSVFEGRPVVLSDPTHPVSRAIFELAHSFCPVFSAMISADIRRRPGLGRFLDALRRW